MKHQRIAFKFAIIIALIIIWLVMVKYHISKYSQQTAYYHNPLRIDVNKDLNLSTNEKFAIIETNKGNITLELYRDEMPLTTNFFISLAKKGFYNNQTVSILVKHLYMQFRSPLENELHDSWSSIDREESEHLKPKQNTLALLPASDEKGASRQLIIFLKEADYNKNVIGSIVEGNDVLERLEKGDKILSLTVY